VVLSGADGIIAVSWTFMLIDSLRLALLEDLFDDLVLVAGAELILQARLGRGVHLTLCTLLVCDQDLERVHDLGQGDGVVLLPVGQVLRRLDEDDEVIAGAFVEDFGDGSVSARHVGR